MRRGAPLTRRTPLKQGKPLANGSTLTRRTAPKRVPVSPASAGQREKVRDRPSIISGDRPCDPCHVWPRGMGGCDDPACVIPLTREEHRAFDAGQLDVLGAMVGHGMYDEIAHAVVHARGDMVAVLHRLTGDHYEPVEP